MNSLFGSPDATWTMTLRYSAGQQKSTKNLNGLFSFKKQNKPYFNFSEVWFLANPKDGVYPSRSVPIDSFHPYEFYADVENMWKLSDKVVETMWQ